MPTTILPFVLTDFLVLAGCLSHVCTLCPQGGFGSPPQPTISLHKNCNVNSPKWCHMPYACLSPGRIGPLELTNKLVFPAMTMGFCDAGGHVTPRLVQFHETRAKGGVGLFILEGAAVRRDGQAYAGQLGLWDDAHIATLQRLVQVLHQRGVKVAVQLSHAGRLARPDLTGLPAFAPSACMHRGAPVRAAQAEQLATLPADFARAARRAVMAGADAVELNAGQGELLQQLHSRATNHRDDAYGGSVEHRTRLSRAILQALRRELGADRALLLQLGVEEHIPDGLTLAESLLLARHLAEKPDARPDVWHVTTGHPDTLQGLAPSWAEPAGTRVERAAAVRAALQVPVIAGGRIRSLEAADALLAEHKADFVALGRSLITDPLLPRKAATGFGHRVRTCISCDTCLERLRNDQPVCCAVNPFVGREADEYLLYPPAKPLHVLVAGGGPSGLVAACALRHKGYGVTLLEKSAEPGGRLRGALHGMAGSEVEAYATYMIVRAREMGVDIRCNQEAVPPLVERLRPHAVVAAVGGLPFVPPVPGLDETPFQLVAATRREGFSAVPAQAVIVGGGLEGCEAALWLASEGCEVTLVESGPLFAADAGPRNRVLFRERLDELGVRQLANTRVTRATPERLFLDQAGGDRELTAYGTLILATGYLPNPGLRQSLVRRGFSVVETGDCVAPGSLRDAITSGVNVLHVL